MLPKERTENTVGPTGSADPIRPRASPPPPHLSSSLGRRSDARRQQVPRGTDSEAPSGASPRSLWVRNQRPTCQSSCLSSSEKPKVTWLQLPGPQCSLPGLPSISTRPQLNVQQETNVGSPDPIPLNLLFPCCPQGRDLPATSQSERINILSYAEKQLPKEGGDFISTWKLVSGRAPGGAQHNREQVLLISELEGVSAHSGSIRPSTVYRNASRNPRRVHKRKRHYRQTSKRSIRMGTGT